MNISNSKDSIDVYYDMEIAQICEHFHKSRNTVDKAVAKLIKDHPDKDWKYKNPETRRITILAFFLRFCFYMDCLYQKKFPMTIL